jgi:hypothetical protein
MEMEYTDALRTGLWQPAISLERENFKRAQDQFMIQKYLIRRASKDLPLQVGEKYKNVVLRCFSSDLQVENDTTEGLGFQQAFRTKVVDILEQAALQQLAKLVSPFTRNTIVSLRLIEQGSLLASNLIWSSIQWPALELCTRSVVKVPALEPDEKLMHSARPQCISLRSQLG